MKNRLSSQWLTDEVCVRSFSISGNGCNDNKVRIPRPIHIQPHTVIHAIKPHNIMEDLGQSVKANKAKVRRPFEAIYATKLLVHGSVYSLSLICFSKTSFIPCT